MLNLPRTYRKSTGVFYIRLFIPKHLQQPNQPTKLVVSLKTKDIREASVLAFRINLDFEYWVQQMSGGDFKKLTVKYPSGLSVDFDLSKPEEKEAYESHQKQMLSGVDAIGVFRSSQPSQSFQPQVPTVGQYRLDDLFKGYKKATAKTLAENTKSGYYPKVEDFLAYCLGKGKIYIGDIRKPFAVDYREHLMEIKKSPLTVDGFTKVVKGFFDYAIQIERYQFDNPFANMNLVKKSQLANVADSYLPFTKEELLSVFELDGYTKRFVKPDYFYSPIIALTMGLREGEVSQLHLSDVYQINGVWVIDINENSPDKKLKNASSKRILPISKHVLKTNFLEYLEYVKTNFSDQYLLYPYIIRTKAGYGKNLSYNFTEHKKVLPLKDGADKCFHSLRKNIGNAMKDAGYDLALRKTILGHSMVDDVTERVYSGNFGIEYLKQKLDDLDFGIDFSQYQFKVDKKELDDLYRDKNRKIIRGVANASRQSQAPSNKGKK